ncbi:MAG: hypothetical protein ACTSSE_08540 [Candidatus Thorarchaeota archaeon]
MEITREQIENEENYRKLQDIGRTFKEDGHKLVLNAREDELKMRLLVIFDESYALGETETEDIVEDIPEPDEGSVEDVTDIVDEAINDAIEEIETEDIVEDIPEPDEDLFIAPRAYNDWASGWSFTPGMDKPKALPDELTPGLENALKTGKIIPYEG